MEEDWQVCVKDQGNKVRVNKRIITRSAQCEHSTKSIKSARFSYEKETISSKLRKSNIFPGNKLSNQQHTEKTSRISKNLKVFRFSRESSKSPVNFRKVRQDDRNNISHVGKGSDFSDVFMKNQRKSQEVSMNQRKKNFSNHSRLFFPVNEKPLQSERQQSPYDPKQQHKKIFGNSFDFCDFPSPVKISMTPSLLAEGEVTQRARPQTVEVDKKLNNQREIIEISMFNIPEEFSNSVIKELLKTFSISSVTIDAKSRNSGVLTTFARKDVEGIIIKLRKFGIWAQVNLKTLKEKSHFTEFFTESKKTLNDCLKTSQNNI